MFSNFSISFLKLIYFQLKDNCFTEFCCFLSNLSLIICQFFTNLLLLIRCSVTSDSATPWTAACQVSLLLTLPVGVCQTKFISIESVMLSNHLTLCRLLLLLPSIFPSIRVFANESALRIRLSKYWSFSFSLSPSNEYSGLISLRVDWLDLFTVQGTLRNLLQHHNLEASIL